MTDFDLKKFMSDNKLSENKVSDITGSKVRTVKSWMSGDRGMKPAIIMLLKNHVRGDQNEKNESQQPYIEQRRNQKLEPKSNKIPFFDADAEAGMLTETEMTPIHAPSGTIDVGDLLSDSKAAMRIYGNSMNPNYPPGCVVGLIPYFDSSIEPGEVYVIETKSSRRLKRLFYKDDEPESEYLMCYSDNTMKFTGGARDGKLAYPPYYIHKSEIIRIFSVSGVIKRNMNSVIINR